MGRDKYDGNRGRGFAENSDAASRLARGPSPPRSAQAGSTLGEGVFDVVKDLAKKVGPRAVSGLSRSLGRKLAKEIVSKTIPTHAAAPNAVASPPLGPKAQARAEVQPPRPAANDWREKEADGERIREILEANSLSRRSGAQPSRGKPPRRKDKQTPDAQPRPSEKANEVIARLLADDD